MRKSIKQSKTSNWYETFFAGLYMQILNSEKHENGAIEEAKIIKKVLRLRKGKRVLDCPCGMGRITFGLAKLGLDVTGVDLTANYIRRARKRAKELDLEIPFHRCDMRELPFSNEFDAVVNWFTSFGYFNEAGNLAAARAAFDALKPGGKFLIEMMNKSFILPRFRNKSDETVNGVRIITFPRWDAKNSRICNTWTFIKGKKRETHRFSHTLYTAAEMRRLLRKAGFRDVKFLGRPSLGRFTRHSKRMIAIATKPED
ncbi:MAG: methyltransferase domain-containing protein [Phycisphaerae bacterium]|nr:methyltransferase domain-containing protein [Phycisphaerae bacterium]